MAENAKLCSQEVVSEYIEDAESPDKTIDEQNARSMLREKFLRSLQCIYNKPTQFNLHEQTNVTAVFRATDINVENLIVSDLQTPIGPLEEAILRSSDVLKFTVKIGDKENEQSS